MTRDVNKSDMAAESDELATRPDTAGKHVLARLPYAHAALEPHIDSRTMLLHHDMHHAAYVDKLNTALEKAPDFQKKSALWLLLNLAKLPDGIRGAVHNNAGGHVNHSLFWKAMSPAGGGEPSGALADAIARDFGSFAQFKVKFEEAGAEKFGSGWVWLVKAQDEKGSLDVITTSGHDNPLMKGRYPLLLNDVWEHAYYLKHENRRADYLKNWWSVANWQEATRRFASDKQGIEASR